MTEPTDFLPEMELKAKHVDAVRISAYFEAGEVTNIDVMLNHDDIVIEDIERIIAMFRVKARIAGNTWVAPFTSGGASHWRNVGNIDTGIQDLAG